MTINKQLRLVSIGRRLFHTSQAKFSINEANSPKLMYEGKLNKRILRLKGVSMLSSAVIASFYGYFISQKCFGAMIAGMGFAFSPFFLSPLAIAWFFKRYITHLYYNPTDDTYTAHHYGYLLSIKKLTFTKEDVEMSDVTSMLNTFTIGKRPFFLHDEDLIDVEAIELYKRMVGLNKSTVSSRLSQ